MLPRSPAAFVLNWSSEPGPARGVQAIPREEILLRLCSNVFPVPRPVIVQ